MSAEAPDLWLWRHPWPAGAAGRCIGRCDLVPDRRRAKRLAHHIRQAARRHRLPQTVWTSPLRRCADVGRWLARWGWQHQIDASLLELDFGSWDGRCWASIPAAEVAAWEADFAGHGPGGGESLDSLARRCRAFVAARQAEGCRPVLVVAHAGWILACAGPPAGGWQAGHWSAAPRHGSLIRRRRRHETGPAAPGLSPRARPRAVAR